MKEDKIEVGEYVRTKYNGIKRCVHINEEEITNMYWLAGKMVEDIEKKVFIYYGNDHKKIDIDEVVEHSKNIIDLIEVGDYVNGYYVIDDAKKDKKYITIAVNYREYGEEYLKNKEIESVVTKEQFKSVEYRLED